MAERRMFAKTIIDSDAFLDMPHSTQLLYFHLSMRADDDGFINNPKNIMRTVGCKDDDVKILITKKFIIPFESGVVVIKHWKIHNYIRNDRYKETKYKNEKNLLSLDENNAYKKAMDTSGIPSGYQMDTQVRLGKDSIGYINNNNKEDELQKVFIECLGSTNLYAIQECINFLEDLPFEIIENVLKRTAGINFPNWNYAKEILKDYVKREINTLEKIEADRNRFQNTNKTKNVDTTEYKEVTFESEEEYQRKVLGK